jgi:hypothetical protein
LGYFFFPLLAAWVRAEAATLFWAGVDLGLLRILDALDATDGDVFSFLDMMACLLLVSL